jgi:LAO/AO transport system kinase
MRAAAELAAEQYRFALQSLSGDDTPVVLTCSALQEDHVDTVWEAVVQRHERLELNDGLAERRKRQDLHWLWSMVEDQLRRALLTHPAVQAIRKDLEREVLTGITPVVAAARRILDVFGIRYP